MTQSHRDPDYGRAAGPSHDQSGHNDQSTPDQSTPEKLREDAHDATREVKARAREEVESGRQGLADGADALSDAIDAAASTLDDQDREGLAVYARELSSKLANAAGQLEGRSVDDLANDAKHLARNNPALFMLGSIAVGFGLSRFFKASSEREHDDGDQSDRNHDDVRDDDASMGGSGQFAQRDTTPSKTASMDMRGGSDRREMP